MNINYINPIWLVSRLLERCGITTYKARVEFAAHLLAGIVFGFAGFYWHWGFYILWSAWVLVDEFIFDGHWKIFKGQDSEWKDLIWDLCSKLFGIILFIAISLF